MKFNTISLALPLAISAMCYAQPANNAVLPHSESSFVKDAAGGGIAEVKFGELAEQSASNQQVKNFGKKMVDDHTKINDQLKTLASSRDVELPTDMGLKEKASYKLLSTKKGSDFDRAYMGDMVKDHEADIKEFQKQADNAKDSDVRAFASKTLPTLREHLQLAQKIASEIGASTK